MFVWSVSKLLKQEQQYKLKTIGERFMFAYLRILFSGSPLNGRWSTVSYLFNSKVNSFEFISNLAFKPCKKIFLVYFKNSVFLQLLQYLVEIRSRNDVRTNSNDDSTTNGIQQLNVWVFFLNNWYIHRSQMFSLGCVWFTDVDTA